MSKVSHQAVEGQQSKDSFNRPKYISHCGAEPTECQMPYKGSHNPDHCFFM
jgi:hypothetical protein